MFIMHGGKSDEGFVICCVGKGALGSCCVKKYAEVYNRHLNNKYG